MNVVLYCEGPAEDRGNDALLPPPGDPMSGDHLGPAHTLVARCIERTHRVPTPALRFLVPVRDAGKRVRGSDLHVPKLLRRVILNSITLHQAKLVVALVDTDGDKSRRQVLLVATDNLAHASQRVVAAAVQEFEAWLLADQRALRDVLGCADTPPDPTQMAPGEAKSWLRNRVEARGLLADQSQRAAEIRQLRCQLAAQIDLDTLARQPSFRQFLDDLLAAR